MPSRWLPQASDRPARVDSPSPKTEFSAATRISQLLLTRRPLTAAPECPRLATRQFQFCNPAMRRSEVSLPPPRFFLKSSYDCTLTQLVGNQKLRFLALARDQAPDHSGNGGDRDHGANAVLGNPFQPRSLESFSLRV